MIFLVSESVRRAHHWLREFHPTVNPRSHEVVIITNYEDTIRRTRGRRFQPGVDEFVWESNPQMNREQVIDILLILKSMGFDQDEGFRNVLETFRPLQGEN